MENDKLSLPKQAKPLSSLKDRMVYKVGHWINIIAHKSFLVKNSTYISYMTLGR